MSTVYVPVHRAMADLRPWLRKRLGKDPSVAHWDNAEVYWLPDGRLVPATETDFWNLTAAERNVAMPVRAVVLEFEDQADD